jgi:CrcB protein
MQDILWVSIGAIVGANLRYGLARWIGRLIPVNFPWSILIINVTGSFLLGMFFLWARQRMVLDDRWRLLIAVGFCGGYTTFSSFAFDTFDLFQQGRLGAACLNIAANNLLALAAVLGGAYVGQRL